MITVDARGEICPIPLIKAKEAIKNLNGAGTVEVFVDNEIAVQNLKKMAVQMGYGVEASKEEEKTWKVVLHVSGQEKSAEEIPADQCLVSAKKKTVVAVTADHMGDGNEELGKVLIKGFLFAQTQLETLPDTILFYNGGAKLTCEGSDSIDVHHRSEYMEAVFDPVSCPPEGTGPVPRHRDILDRFCKINLAEIGFSV